MSLPMAPHALDLPPGLYAALARRYGDDVAQETALKVWQYPEVHNVEHWASKVARRLWLIERRRNARICPVENDRLPEQVSASNPLARAEARQTLARIAAVAPGLLREAVSTTSLTRVQRHRARKKVATCVKA